MSTSDVPNYVLIAVPGAVALAAVGVVASVLVRRARRTKGK